VESIRLSYGDSVRPCFRTRRTGSLIVSKDGKVLGSELLAQSFTSAKYFHPRPSAAGTGYDATSSGGTNFGPTSQKLMDSIKAAVAQYRTENGLPADALVPGDAVTSSASGLDPHISVKNARLQTARVAKARNLNVEKVLELVEKYTDHRQLGLFGEDGVNVLRLKSRDGQRHQSVDDGILIEPGQLGDRLVLPGALLWQRTIARRRD